MKKLRLGAVLTIVGGLIAGLLVIVGVGPAQAAKPVHIPKPQYEKPLPREVLNQSTARRKVPRGKPGDRALDWPDGHQKMKLAPGARVLKAPTPGSSVSVTPHERAVSRALGIDGPVFSIAGDAPGKVRLSLDHASYAQIYGAGWSSRVRLVKLPPCALTTPDLAQCRTATPLGQQELADTSGVVGDVELAPIARSGKVGPSEDAAAEESTAVVAMTAGPSGASGDFTATSLQPSGSWSQGGATGGFNWNYPIAVPPPGTGTAPDLSLSYNSQSVDGQNSASNTQPSWVGQGWDLNAGFIERTYRTCSDDASLAAADKTPDSCWAGQILTLQMPGGATTAIVKDDGSNTWRPQTDDGYRIERKTGADNGSHQGEYWVVTTTDGTQYTFGREMFTGAAAGDRTNSAWTVPVFSPKSADPCNDQPGKRCLMAYRWNLDMVQDVHLNATLYNYEQETNYYKSQGAGGALLKYVRGGYLSSIRYGLSGHDGGIFATAPQKVTFGVAERCWAYTDPDTGVVHGCTEADFTDGPAAWMDTPADQNCKATGACDNVAPSFWTRKRLTAITTSYWDGDSYEDVDNYALSQSFHNLGDNQLVLDGITRTGMSSSPTITSPPVTFAYDQRENHVEGVHNMPSMLHQRLVTIHTETGQIISVHYADEPGQEGRAKPKCTQATLPANPANNTTSCIPVKWTPLGHEEPILDYFHKYVVTQIDLTDKNRTAPTRPTVYKYVGDPAWHYDDNEVLKPKFRTWGQFRGYQQVDVITGDANANIVGPDYGGTNDKQTLARTFYLRGMHGDKAATGNRSITVTPTEGTGITDSNQYAGVVYETQQYNGAGGALISKTVSRPVTVDTTATRDRDGLSPLTATIVRTARADTYTATATGGQLIASTATSYDARGRAVELTTSATGAVGNCVKTTYVDNDARWIRDKASEVRVYETTCPTSSVPSPTLLKASRTYYDGATALGTIELGEATRQEDAKASSSWITTETTYDGFGRITSTKALNPGASSGDRLTSVAYTPTGTGALTKTTTTLPNASHVAQRWSDPARGHATKAVGVDGLITEGSFDALGRLTAVWKPGQIKGVDQATEKYDYLIGPDKPLAITTSTLVDPGNGTTPTYRKRVVIYDAFGAVRQAQLAGVGNTVAVTDSYTDTHGWPVKNYDHWYTIGAPTTDLLGGINESSVDGWKVTTYDGAGRPTAVTARKGVATTTGTITTVYGGDRVTVIPPTGGVTHTSVINGLGQKTEFDQYTTTPTRSGDVITGGAPQVIRYTYDGAGRQKTQVTAHGTAQATTWTNTYDLLGRVTQAVSPDAGATTNTYFDTGEVATTKDANNKTIAYDYDVLGRKVGKYVTTLSGTQLASWTYDTLLKGHLTASSTTVSGSTYTKAVTGYDGAGRPLGEKVSLNQLGLNADYTSSTTWTTTGLPATSTFAGSQTPSGAGSTPEQVTYSYDAVGNPRTMVGTNAYVSSSTYTPYGEASQFVLGVNDQTGSLSFTRDVETRDITQVVLSGQSAYPQIEKLAYTHDAVGNVTKMVDTQGGAPTSPVETHCYTYDKLRQLTEAWSSTDACATRPSQLGNTTKVGGPQPYALSWTFDNAGNRTKQVALKTGTMTANETTTSTIGGTGFTHHQVAKTELKRDAATTATTTRSFTYDAAGNTTKRTITTGSTSEVTTFGYGPDGTTDAVTVPTGNSKYVRDADGNILLRADTVGSTKTTTLFLPGQEISVAVTGTTVGATTVNKYYTFNGVNVGMRVNKGNVRYLLADHHGTNQVAVNPLDWTVVRRTMDPYGNQIGATTPSGTSFPGTHTFINKPHVALTKLVDIGARLYDPIIGRFVSVDPILAPDDPQQANGYSYSDNNPVSFTDPTGLMLLNSPGGGGGSSVKTEPSSPPSSSERFKDGFVQGAGEAGREILDSLNPENIFKNIKNMAGEFLDNPVKSGWNFVKNLVKSFSHIGELKDAWKAYQNEDWTELGRVVGKLVIDVGADIGGMILGGGTFKLLDAALKRDRSGSEASGDDAADSQATDCLRSFGEETLVLMGDGSMKKISDITVGERVIATDPETDRRVRRRVNFVYLHSDRMGHLLLRDGTVLRTTEDHLFWSVTDHRFERADQLSPGELVFRDDGASVAVVRFSESRGASAAAFNLSIEGVHTYHVGRPGILVHNDCYDISDDASAIAAHANEEFLRPGGIDHFVSGVHPNALEAYVDGILEGIVPNLEMRYGLRNGRTAYWDPDKKAVTILDGSGGTVFTPRDGKDYFDYEIE